MKRLLASAFAFALPVVVFGQSSGQIGSLFRQILNFIGDVVDFLGPLLIAIALLAFFWSLVRFLYEKDKTKESKDFLVWSILILFVMVSIWGIVRFIQSNLGINPDTQTTIPRVQVGNL